MLFIDTAHLNFESIFKAVYLQFPYHPYNTCKVILVSFYLPILVFCYSLANSVFLIRLPFTYLHQYPYNFLTIVFFPFVVKVYRKMTSYHRVQMAMYFILHSYHCCSFLGNLDNRSDSHRRIISQLFNKGSILSELSGELMILTRIISCFRQPYEILFLLKSSSFDYRCNVSHNTSYKLVFSKKKWKCEGLIALSFNSIITMRNFFSHLSG